MILQIPRSETKFDTEAENKLNKIKLITERNQGKNEFLEKSCVICLEDFEVQNKVDGEKVNIAPANPRTSNKDTFPTVTPESPGHKYSNLDVKEYKTLLNSAATPKEEDTTVLIGKVGISGIAKLDCGHTFHPQCISEWMGKQNKCPTCRSIIDSKTESTFDKKPLQQGLVEIQTDLHPSLANYNFTYGSIFLWTNPSVTLDDPYGYNSGRSHIYGGFEGGWNNAGGAEDTW